MANTRKRGPAYSRRQKRPVKKSRPRPGDVRQRRRVPPRQAAPPQARTPVREPVRDPDDRPRALLGFVVGVVVGLVALGGLWAAIAFHGGGVAETGRNAADQILPGSGARTSAPTGGAAPARPTALQSCRQQHDVLRQALRAVGPAMTQWEIHVGAMNKLVAGAISLSQANAFWNNTRVDARQNLSAFYAAQRQASRLQAACPGPMAAMPGMSQSAGLRSCARRVAADRRVLSAADTAMATWRHHVLAMNMLRMGSMTPATATRMWLASWQEGVRQIQAYHHAAHAAHAAGSC